MDCSICVAKIKALISFAVTAKLICVFVFAYAKSRFSHYAAHSTVSLTFISLAFVFKQKKDNVARNYAMQAPRIIHAISTLVA